LLDEFAQKLLDRRGLWSSMLAAVVLRARRDIVVVTVNRCVLDVPDADGWVVERGEAVHAHKIARAVWQTADDPARVGQGSARKTRRAPAASRASNRATSASAVSGCDSSPETTRRSAR